MVGKVVAFTNMFVRIEFEKRQAFKELKVCTPVQRKLKSQ